MTQNHNGATLKVKVDARPALTQLRRADAAVAKSMHATASALHGAAATNYRRALHRHGAAHPTTAEARRVATLLSFYLADARGRLNRTRVTA